MYSYWYNYFLKVGVYKYQIKFLLNFPSSCTPLCTKYCLSIIQHNHQTGDNEYMRLLLMKFNTKQN